MPALAGALSPIPNPFLQLVRSPLLRATPVSFMRAPEKPAGPSPLTPAWRRREEAHRLLALRAFPGAYSLSLGQGLLVWFYKRECQEQTPPQSCRRVLLGSAFSPSFARCVRASCDGCLRDPIWVCRQLGFRFRGHANFLPRASSEAVSIPRTSLSLPIAWVFAGYAKCRVLKRHSAETVT